MQDYQCQFDLLKAQKATLLSVTGEGEVGGGGGHYKALWPYAKSSLAHAF